MKIMTKISLVSMVILLIVVASLTNYANLTLKETFNQNKEQQLETVKKGVYTVLDSQFDLLAIGIEPIIQNNQIIEAFANRDREQLAQLTLPMMEKLAELGVRQFQFHLPDATSFFRVHEPEKFGDDLSSFRFTVVEANEKQEVVTGFEGGVAGAGFRYVVPLYHENKHIGSVELGMGVTENLLEELKDDYQGDWSLFAIEENQPTWVIGTTEEKQSHFNGMELGALQNKQELTIMNDEKLLIALPLEDYSGSVKWYLEQEVDYSANATQETKQLYTLLFIGVLLSALGVIILYVLTRRILKPLSVITKKVEQVAKGDLTIEQSKITSKDEIGILAKSFNEMAGSLKELIMNILKKANELSDRSKVIYENTKETESGTNEIVEAIQEISSGAEISMKTSEESARAMEEMSSGIVRVAENTTVIADSAHSMNELANKGNVSVTKAVSQMNIIENRTTEFTKVLTELAEDSNEIGSIMQIITGIAEQTNLLALNAAIEAARAGEAGKGFAVVAEEIRKLADQTSRSATKVHELISDIQNKSHEAVKSMGVCREEVSEGTDLINNVGEIFSKIEHAIFDVTKQIEDLSALAEEMSAGAEQVAASVQEIASQAKIASGNATNVAVASEEQLATIAEVTATTKELSEMAEELEISVQQFRVS